MTTMKIKVYSQEQRQSSEWESLKGLLNIFSESEILEQVQRYQDAQKHALAYRERAKQKKIVLESRLAQAEARLLELEEGA